MGLWIDGNPTRDAKEAQDLYLFLRKYPNARLSGIAVGNEVLYRQTMHPDALAQKVSEVKAMVCFLFCLIGLTGLLHRFDRSAVKQEVHVY